MEVVKRGGKAKSIGVSNYQQSHLQATLQTATIPPAVNQVEYHPYLLNQPLVTFQNSRAIATACYGLLAPLTKVKSGPINDTIGQLTQKYAVSEAEIIIRWALDQEMIVVTTSHKESRLSDYLRTLTFKLTPREVQEISQKGESQFFRGFWARHFESADTKINE
jgi:diketogulonate reductase-like aldo/keto reductase